MGGIESESFWVLRPDFAYVFERREAPQRLEPAGVIVGVDEVREVAPELVMVVVVVSLDGRFLDGPVHPLDLPVGPWMFWLGQAMLDAMAPTGPVERVAAELCGGPVSVLRHIGELDAVVGQNDLDLIGDGFDQGVEEGRRGYRVGSFDDLDKGELRCPVDRDVKIELSFSRADFRQIDMEEADRIALELLPGRPVALHIGQPTDPMTMQTAMQG